MANVSGVEITFQFQPMPVELQLSSGRDAVVMLYAAALRRVAGWSVTDVTWMPNFDTPLKQEPRASFVVQPSCGELSGRDKSGGNLTALLTIIVTPFYLSILFC